jgi:hypothetical protein
MARTAFEEYRIWLRIAKDYEGYADNAKHASDVKYWRNKAKKANRLANSFR